jgi:hypothetical protein
MAMRSATSPNAAPTKTERDKASGMSLSSYGYGILMGHSGSLALALATEAKNQQLKSFPRLYLKSVNPQQARKIRK